MIVARCPWYIAGPLLGLLVVGLRATLNRGFGAAGGYVDVVRRAFTSSRLGFNGYLLGGFVLGGAVFAMGTGQSALGWDYASLGTVLSGANPLAQGALLLLAVTHEPIAWTLERPQSRHVVGSMVFGVGWSLAGTCPGPVAVMIGQGRLTGLVVVAGLLAGVSLQGGLAKRRAGRAR